jgi:hypothetical protein
MEFISRALAPDLDLQLDLRKRSRLLVIGDVRVPRVTVRYDSLGASARLTVGRHATRHRPRSRRKEKR